MERKLLELASHIHEIYEEISRLKDGVISAIGKGQICAENEVVPRVEIALEGYKTVYEKQVELDRRFDMLEEKIRKHDIEIEAIKRCKTGSC